MVYTFSLKKKKRKKEKKKERKKERKEVNLSKFE
jgi:hypothetical protein